jgi:hypothetical protein
MKYTPLNQRGFSYHIILPVLTMLAVSVIGVHVFTASHAATPTYFQMLNAADAASTPGVSQIQSSIQSLGTQTVSQVLPGAELDYLIGGKVPVDNICYYFQIMPLKGGGTVAKIAFGGIGAMKTLNIPYDATRSGYLQKVCVPTDNGATPAYSVKNLSPETGPEVLVYQAEVAQVK